MSDKFASSLSAACPQVKYALPIVVMVAENCSILRVSQRISKILLLSLLQCWKNELPKIIEVIVYFLRLTLKSSSTADLGSSTVVLFCDFMVTCFEIVES